MAASLREIGLALANDLAGADPITRVETSFGASSALAYQIRLGAPLDVLVSADDQIVDALVAEDHLAADSVRELARGAIVLAAVAGSPSASQGLEALRSPALRRLGLPHEAVPLGRYGAAWLRELGDYEQLDGRIVRTEDARANLAALEQGHVDLALLYRTDLLRARGLTEIARPRGGDRPAVRYIAARRPQSRGCAEVDRVLEELFGEATRARLDAAGFDPPTRPAPTPARAPKGATL